MALDGFGRPIVSDGTNGGIYRLEGDRLGRIDKGDFISPQTMALAGDRRHLIVPDYVRGIGILDLTDSSVRWIRNSVAAGCPTNGIDGIYVYGEDILVTQNGVNPERITAIRLSSDMGKIIGSTVIEQSPRLGDPTHGVMVGRSFFFIANSGWDVLGDDGQIRSGAAMPPATVLRYDCERP
jgi:hypothetical protein